jgi:hypothetical protein
LVRSLGVVIPHPPVEGVLSRLEQREGAIGEELFSHALVEALDLAGRGRRARLREFVGDAVLATHAIEHDLDVVGAEASGEDLAVERDTPSLSATSMTFQPSCTTAMTAW